MSASYPVRLFVTFNDGDRFDLELLDEWRLAAPALMTLIQRWALEHLCDAARHAKSVAVIGESELGKTRRERDDWKLRAMKAEAEAERLRYASDKQAVAWKERATGAEAKLEQAEHELQLSGDRLPVTTRVMRCFVCSKGYDDGVKSFTFRRVCPTCVRHPRSEREQVLVTALRDLRIDANRLCDRMLGGTYEDDCRRSIAKADLALDQDAPRVHDWRLCENAGGYLDCLEPEDYIEHEVTE